MSDWSRNAGHLARTVETRFEAFDNELVSRLVFRIGGHAIAHDPERVGELIRDPVVYRVPNVPGMFAGLVNRRGRVVPVYDIRHLLPPAGNGTVATDGIEWVLVFYEHEHDQDSADEVDDAVGLVIDEMPLRLRMAPLPSVRTDSLAEFFRPWCLRVHERERVCYGELDIAAMMESIRAGAESTESVKSIEHEQPNQVVPVNEPGPPDSMTTDAPATGVPALSSVPGWSHERNEYSEDES